MGDYKLFPAEAWTIKEKDLIRVLHDAANHGYKPLVMINGMYYNLELEQNEFFEEVDDYDAETGVRRVVF